MKRSIEDTSVVFIGAGNLATNLAKALYYKGFRIVQVYSRTEESARTLAQAVEAAYTTDLSSVAADARLYIVSLKDAAFAGSMQVRPMAPSLLHNTDRNLSSPGS